MKEENDKERATVGQITQKNERIGRVGIDRCGCIGVLECDCTKSQRIKRGYKGTKRVSNGESDLERYGDGGEGSGKEKDAQVMRDGKVIR